MKRALVALAILTAACSDDAARPGTATAFAARPVRVGVTLPPEPTANTYGGNFVRALVYPQLFRATPGGKWQPSLVQPGSDATRLGARSAKFRLRANARWSDGTRIGVADLRRSADTSLVSAVDAPTANGTIVVHFTRRLVDWRALWSGSAAVSPPREGVFGGPYVIDHVTSGLETVLKANRRYWGTRPAIDEVHLVLVPAAEVQARLMDKGELDVIAPFAFTDRTRRLERIDHASVIRGGTRGGWTASLVANPSRLTPAQRQTMFALANAPRFTDVLLHGEATATGTQTPAPPAPATPGTTPSISAPLESSPATLLLHAMQRAAHKAGRDFDLRQADFDRVLDAYASGQYDVMLSLEPGRIGNGDPSDRRQIADFVVLPLWRERQVIAVRDGLRNVSANGFNAAGWMWNVEMWRWGS